MILTSLDQIFFINCFGLNGSGMAVASLSSAAYHFFSRNISQATRSVAFEVW